MKGDRKMEERKTVTVGGMEMPIHEYQKLRSAGKIVHRPKVGEDGIMRTASGAEYTRAPDGSLRRVGGRKRMSKKDRRKMRKEAFAAEE